MTIKLMAKGSTPGLTEEHMKDPGKTTICTAKAPIHGVMAENMTANTTWIKSMATVCIFGQMAVATKVTGKMGSNMEKGNTSYQMV